MANPLPTPAGAPAIGTFVSVPFGQSRQVAQVVGYSRDGRTIKVRAWNNAQGKWMPNPRPVPFGAWVQSIAEPAMAHMLPPIA